VSKVPVGDISCNVFVDKLALTRVEIKSSRRNQLALGLVDNLFDPRVLEMSTVHGSCDGSKKPLDPKVVEAIRSKTNRHFRLHIVRQYECFISSHRSLLQPISSIQGSENARCMAEDVQGYNGQVP
jgi:hypothetical protein